MVAEKTPLTAEEKATITSRLMDYSQGDYVHYVNDKGGSTMASFMSVPDYALDQF